jgi:hypothetical protein
MIKVWKTRAFKFGDLTLDAIKDANKKAKEAAESAYDTTKETITIGYEKLKPGPKQDK